MPTVQLLIYTAKRLPAADANGSGSGTQISDVPLLVRAVVGRTDGHDGQVMMMRMAE